MAKQESNYPFTGRIGNLIYYKRNSKYFARRAGFPSREQIMLAPEFDKTRRHICEFGACAHAGHDLREAIASLIARFVDKDITGRINGLFSKIIKNGVGEMGSRKIEISRNREVIRNFQFNKHVSFDQVFRSYIHFSADAVRREAGIVIENIDPLISFGKLNGESHFRMFVCMVCFSDMQFDAGTNRYQPINRDVHCSTQIVYSERMSVKEVWKDIYLSCRLGSEVVIPESAGVMLMVGIEFFKEEHGVMYGLHGRNCMKVGEVF